MLCVPTVSELEAQVAVRTLPLPVRETAEQPESELAPSLKLTLPVGALPVTVAVKVTLVPAVDGVSEVPNPTVLVALLTVWVSVALPDGALEPSPP